VTPADRTVQTAPSDAAAAAAGPERALATHLAARPRGLTLVIGAGNGAAQLAAAFGRLWEGPLEGVAVTRYGHACPTAGIRVPEAAHPGA